MKAWVRGPWDGPAWLGTSASSLGFSTAFDWLPLDEGTSRWFWSRNYLLPGSSLGNLWKIGIGSPSHYHRLTLKPLGRTHCLSERILIAGYPLSAYFCVYRCRVSPCFQPQNVQKPTCLHMTPIHWENLKYLIIFGATQRPTTPWFCKSLYFLTKFYHWWAWGLNHSNGNYTAACPGSVLGR